MIYFSFLVGGYCIASAVYVFRKYRRVICGQPDGNNTLISNKPPTVGVELIVYSPLGRGLEKEIKVYSRVAGREVADILHEPDVRGEVEYMNTLETLTERLRIYGIPTTTFRISLPMKVVKYHFPNGVHILDNVASADKIKLVTQYARKQRFPLTDTCWFLLVPLILYDINRKVEHEQTMHYTKKH